ncbi:DUF3821 domain-containing protein [Methanomicrobium antiquum]|uniref:DUF3821 domain-containing protein n=1 Tax=Methanomicrobium antiquum TaxID=487686 RepID=A0AAF0FWI5_9EURY|nr:MEMAR_RS02690 family S-layer glycoprotein [Methanomicrobium antiquum]WFN36289.1 DUF3821 domain-containing protein [Methanomicrobium antiquum]
MTSKKFGIALLSLLVLALFAVAPAMAADAYSKNISAGETVFIGESGLNIETAVNSQPYISYWAPGTAFTDAPTKSINMTAGLMRNFFVDPSDFSGATGSWYQNTGTGPITGTAVLAFVVEQPSLGVTAWSTTGTSLDGKKVISKGNVVLRIDSNFYKMFARDDKYDNSTGLNLYVENPDGATLNKLWNGTVLNSISALQPNVQTWYVNNVSGASSTISTWYLDSTRYSAGEYKIWAESNLNAMKDNLGSVTGKTVSNTATITVDKETVSITADKETVVRGNGFAITVDAAPKTDYALWISGTNGSSNVPPTITVGQDDVTINDASAAAFAYKSGTTVIADTYGADRYAMVKTSASGTITVGFTTDSDTSDSTYTIRAQKHDLSNLQLYDTVKVKVEKGAVTVTASGDGSYYLGEEVVLSGTNTDSDDVYLFITGPNLPTSGGMITEPAHTVNPFGTAGTDYLSESVKTDDTWEYKWDTSAIGVDAGTYTIYAVAENVIKSNLSGRKYDTVSIVVKKPFVTATVSASTVAKGDKFYIRGTAEGNPTKGVAIWILGKNYWNGENTDLTKCAAVTTTVNDDGSFEEEIASGATADMASGQYFVVVQHPMYNGDFDVYVNATSASYTYVEGKAKNSDKINNQFVIWGSGKLQGSDAATALINAINSPDIDDTYTKLTFLIEEPWIRINSIGDHYIGDQFKITGTTNLAIDDDLIVEVTSSSFQPTEKTQSGEFSGVSSTVKVTEGDSYNEWALDVDASTFKADEYIVNVEAIEADVTATTTFNVLKSAPTTAPTDKPTTAPTTGPTTVPTTPTPEPTASPGFGVLVALAGLGAVAALVMRKD